jgi:uridine kinase/DNA-binding Xre family transcriptional regulator
MRLTNQVKVLRAKEGLTQKALAKKVGLTRQSIHAIETGSNSPSVTVALKMAAVLGTTVEGLFKIEREHSDKGVFFLGIGGVSQSGKSTLARKIRKKIGDRIVRVFELDQYTIDTDEMPRVHGKPDWEQPESYDFERLRKDIELAEAVSDVIILDRIHAFQDEKLTAMMHLKLMIKVPYEVFLERRRKDTRWGDEPEWYYDHVWNMYLQHQKFVKDDINLLSGIDSFPSKKIVSKIRSGI